MPSLSAYATFVRGLPALTLGSRRTFTYDGRPYRYFYDRYLYTWLNERCVELPLAFEAYDGARGADVLEVGNVLGHYGRGGHTVVDRYEQAPGVTNVDVLELAGDDRTYDLIISVSTLEHVGVDDTPKDTTRAIAALRLLADRVRDGGRLLATVPVGYNPTLDHAIASGIDGLEVTALRRVAPGPHWVQAAPAEVVDLGYDSDVKSARGVLIVRR